MKGEFDLFDRNSYKSDDNRFNSLHEEDDISNSINKEGFNHLPNDREKQDSMNKELQQWKIVIVDNDQEVISITKQALKGFRFLNGSLTFLEAHHYKNVKEIMLENNDIAIIFFGVSSENYNACLEQVKYIREDLKNELVQIVLTSCESNQTLEKKMLSEYRINFYQSKSDLTENKIFTLTTSLLNTFNAQKTVREYNKNLRMLIAEKTLDLKVKNEEYKNAIATKNKMFSIIAHDLINPFNSLLGFSDILRTQCHELPPEKIKQFSDVIWQTSRSTYDLLYNLLEWARIQTGKIKFNPSKTSICRLLNTNIELLRLQASQKNLQLSFSCNDSIEVFCDSNMINTVLRNLISNGIKFTCEGGVNVNVFESGTNCIIEVADTGIGISAAKLKNIFNPDLTSASGTAGESGSGIGLMLCKEFTSINNGTIEVTSKINKGSTFTLTLPLYKF